MSLSKRSRIDKIFDSINITILTISLMLVLYPLYYIVIASISDPNAIYNGEVVLLPKDILWEGYQRIFNDISIWTGYRNSLVYTITGTTINLLLTLPAAYALSRRNLDGRKAFLLFITFTMFFNGGLIPTYLLIKQLGMVNNMWSLVIPNAVGVWNLLVAKSFFENSLPEELREASVLDGCNDWNYFMRVALPLSKALIAVLILFYGVQHWNAFFNALIYIRDEKLFPLQIVLRNILIQNEAGQEMTGDLRSLIEQQRIADLVKYGVIIVASLPLMILYPFLQKYFVKGVMIGAVKG